MHHPRYLHKTPPAFKHCRNNSRYIRRVSKKRLVRPLYCQNNELLPLSEDARAQIVRRESGIVPELLVMLAAGTVEWPTMDPLRKPTLTEWRVGLKGLLILGLL